MKFKLLKPLLYSLGTLFFWGMIIAILGQFGYNHVPIISYFEILWPLVFVVYFLYFDVPWFNYIRKQSDENPKPLSPTFSNLLFWGGITTPIALVLGLFKGWWILAAMLLSYAFEYHDYFSFAETFLYKFLTILGSVLFLSPLLTSVLAIRFGWRAKKLEIFPTQFYKIYFKFLFIFNLLFFLLYCLMIIVPFKFVD